VNVPAEIFRAYDIRGIAGRTLTAATVGETGERSERSTRAQRAGFAVGRDGRLSSPKLSVALMDGLNAGADVIDIGIVPTPEHSSPPTTWAAAAR
jgi:phosphomannomutase/phosphoglucomutase